MKKQQIKLGLFAATITVLLISMGNLPIATAIPIIGTLTVIEFCDLQLGTTSMAFTNSVAGSTTLGGFNLENFGTGISTATILGAAWFETPTPGSPILDITDTSYEVVSNSVSLIAFTGSAQALGDFEGGGSGPEQVGLSVSVTPNPITFTGTLDTTVTVTETTCVAA